jgi:hypothetical protein
MTTSNGSNRTVAILWQPSGCVNSVPWNRRLRGGVRLGEGTYRHSEVRGLTSASGAESHEAAVGRDPVQPRTNRRPGLDPAMSGWVIAECEDPDGAVRLATTIPAAWYGSVEVRPADHTLTYLPSSPDRHTPPQPHAARSSRQPLQWHAGSDV